MDCALDKCLFSEMLSTQIPLWFRGFFSRVFGFLRHEPHKTTSGTHRTSLAVGKYSKHAKDTASRRRAERQLRNGEGADSLMNPTFALPLISPPQSP
jgi:hypothetical protein